MAALFSRKKTVSANPSQRRENFRMPVSIQASLYGPGDPECIRAKPCTLLNLSAGGACLRSEFLYGAGVPLKLRFCMRNSEEPITVSCKIVRAKPLGKAYEYGVRFFDIGAGTGNKIAKFLYDLESAHRKWQ